MTTGMQALSDFVDHYDIERDSTGRCEFAADIEFSGAKNVSEETTAVISFHTGDGSQVRLKEYGDLTSNDFHLEFIERIQKMDFDGEVLTITGTSPKMGNYKVVLQPAR